jgi:hypothetical protein
VGLNTKSTRGCEDGEGFMVYSFQLVHSSLTIACISWHYRYIRHENIYLVRLEKMTDITTHPT